MSSKAGKRNAREEALASDARRSRSVSLSAGFLPSNWTFASRGTRNQRSGLAPSVASCHAAASILRKLCRFGALGGARTGRGSRLLSDLIVFPARNLAFLPKSKASPCSQLGRSALGRYNQQAPSFSSTHGLRVHGVWKKSLPLWMSNRSAFYEVTCRDCRTGLGLGKPASPGAASIERSIGCAGDLRSGGTSCAVGSARV